MVVAAIMPCRCFGAGDADCVFGFDAIGGVMRLLIDISTLISTLLHE